LPMLGQFNLSNGLAVLAALCVYGVPFKQAVQCLSQLKSVPGRMQLLGGGNHPAIIVDYAHKPDALLKVLEALRSHTKGKLWCVFGCGGERDRGKRPLMASIAERLADHVIVTNDNPRHEKPEEIVAEILQGFSHPERITIELDRSKAIQNSIQWASAEDCILIAGKGAELYQQIGDEKIPFDDVEKVREYLCYCG
jgi:UDP-N-acetylmuramoyl-L-alanyl-D-glutamate--2,6-diaminopimelate ligase